jgi:hypothetical protein
MASKLIFLAVLLSFGAGAQSLPKFMGRVVTVIEPEREYDFFPKGPASVCIEGPPQKQCYTAPKDFARDPTVAPIQLDKDTPALLFSASSGGVSTFGIHFALLRPGIGKDLQDLFFSDVSVSNQSQFAFWSEPSISPAQIFLTADAIGGPDETNLYEHRCIISAYVLRSPLAADDLYYYLEDRYMTARKYDLAANADILASEKQEIFARLRRVKAAAQSHH